MPNLNETPSDLIKKKIKETGIKQAHLAKKLGITPQRLNKILARNQDKSPYLPKIAEILGIEETKPECRNIKNIPILSGINLISWASELVSFEELEHVIFQSWPLITNEDYSFYGYKLTENISSEIRKEDLLIFNHNVPDDITGKIGIAFIKNMALIFCGRLKYNHDCIIIYNEYDCFEIKQGDKLLGIAVYLGRNM